MPMPKGNPWKAMELKMPPEEVVVVDYFARRRGVSHSQWLRDAAAAITYAEHRKLERDDPAEYRRVVDAIRLGRLDSL